MLNFSKFQKVAEDDKTVTMRHEKGHEMRILLKQLRPIEREQIKRLKMADGGKVQKFADSEDTVQPDDSSDQSSQAAPDKSITINVGQPSPQSPLAQPAQVAPAPAPNVPASPQVAPTQNAGNPTDAALTQSRALQLGQQAGNSQQAVDTAKAQGSVPIAEQQQQNAVANAQRIDNTIKDFQQHTQDMARYLSDPKNTNPSAFYENMGVPQKITTALGLILGGFKQGVAGGNNPAYDWLKDQQEKDISAQRQRAENQKTVWGAYNSLYGNENISTELAKKSWADKLAGDANVLAARLGTPQAAINNQKFQADLLKSGYDNLQKAAFIANQPQGGQPEQSGQGASGASVEPSQQKGGEDYSEKDGARIYPVLAPDALNKSTVATQNPLLDKGKLQSQLTSADQIDKVINGPKKDGQGGIHQLLQDMYQDIGQGSLGGSLEQRVKGAAQHIPYVGDLGEKGLNAVYSGEGYKSYASKRTGMIQDLSTALQGLVAPTDIIKLVDDNLPIHGDSSDDVDMKEKAIVNGIRKAMKTDELSKAGLLPKGQK